MSNLMSRNLAPEIRMLATVLHHPRKLWVRKALFQVHLWLGVLLSLYVAVIGVSGSILVFQDEIRLASVDHASLNRASIASLGTVIANARERFPTSRLTFVGLPQQPNPWWTLYLEDERGNRRLAYADAHSGATLTNSGRLFIDTVLDLHVYLLAGQTGFIVNCVAGIGLFLLAITGAILWWPGIKLWRRALTVNLRHGWRRINYDLHNAVGIWTLAIVSWWGITAAYFLFPQKVAALVDSISPLVTMRPPASPEPSSSTAIASLDQIVASLPPTASAHLSGVSLPDKPGSEVTIYIDRASPGDFSNRDILTFDGHSGRLLTTWHYGENKSLGDWVLWLMYPLHFGTLWGYGVKVLWAFLGLCVTLLSATGLLMYWNRKLRKLIDAR
jgi:uncharacterized iron-regulated membrane protein